MNRSSFRSELAQRTMKRRDRNIAPFFAGRAKEIELFESAVENARDGSDTAAAFLICQGPPGCGKTSLANHLRLRYQSSRKGGEGVLFVQPELSDMNDMESLVRFVSKQALPRPARMAGATGRALKSPLVKPEVVGGMIEQTFAGLAARKKCTVLHIDEAQARARGEAFGATLLSLHTNGLRWDNARLRCVVLLTGLGYTAKVVSAHEGLSRLAVSSVVEMGALSRQECVESTLKMLRELRAEGTDTEKATLAEWTAELSFGWPQHLSIAQSAVCRELLRTDGEVRGVLKEAVREETAAGRESYYAARLDHQPMDRYPLMTRRIVAELKTAPVSVEGPALENFCERVVREHDPHNELQLDRPTLEAIAEQLEHKGVIARRGYHWKLAIPSMGDWAAREVKVRAPEPEQARL